ncbi:UDP-glucose 4-epimerase GalE [Brackiella oedipodis]|uniref:UDP-glucose 4-epimerase GalE n=1 Tax=Brackiella oedipodis TaxID=124225 RepID=UPI0004921367|nr:UDP-glucose 4-epimerase GalE [Brackiella oedipodis]
MSSNKTILVTGGCGYIGSHTVVELIQRGYEPIVFDNLSNSSRVALERVKQITGHAVPFIQGDILDKNALNQVFADHQINAVIHFAGLKAVGESTQKPLEYYQTNVYGTIQLLQTMREHDVFNVVFSSSATVYGNPQQIPITEECPLGQPTNPYGMSKLMAERIMQDLSKSDERWSIALLRYFNPIGAHPSGLMGEDPSGIPNNLMPFVTQVAIGKLPQLSIFGDDYDTQDGTAIRDYIHVVDLANGHLAALDYLKHHASGCHVWNLGTGNGYSVLQIVQAFEKNNQVHINYKIAPRRPGDIAECWSDPSKAKRELNWQAQLGLDEMMRHSWHWQSNNPNGYRD